MSGSISQHDHNMDAMPLQHSRGDKTPLELFVAGVQAWETGRRRQLENNKFKFDG
jgi:hypothetical protein